MLGNELLIVELLFMQQMTYLYVMIFMLQYHFACFRSNKICRNVSFYRNKHQICSHFDIKITCLILVYIPWRRNCGGWWCNKQSIRLTFLFIFFVTHDEKTSFIERTIIFLECVFLSDFEVTLNTTFITKII